MSASTPTSKPLRNDKGQLLPGQVLNPGGRPKGLEKRVRELVDFDAITLALQDIALGKLPPGITGETTVKIKDRIEAAKLLYDRGHGKARAIVDLAHDITHSGLSAIDVDELDAAAFEALEVAVAKAVGERQGNVIDAPAPTPDPSLAHYAERKSE